MMFNMFITFHQNRNNFVKFLHHVMNRWGSTRACTRKPFCMAWGIKTPQCHKSSAFCRRKQACWPGSSPNISESLIKSYASFCKFSKILQDLIESYEDAFWRHFGSFRFFQFLLPSNCLGWWDSASMDPGRSCLRRTTLQEIAVFHRVQRNLPLCKYSASSNIYDL